MRSAKIYLYDEWVGLLKEDEKGYHFTYLIGHLNRKEAEAVSLTLPLQKEPFESKVLFPFFDGLIPEGWLLDITEKNWKLNSRDRMGILMVACRECIGAVGVEAIINEE